MNDSDAPKDGDFAGYLVRKAQAPTEPKPDAKRQTIEEVLVQGEEPTEEFLEEFAALESAAPLSEEELAQQALQHPGGDGDASTPE
jgi:hypothetical protein